MKLKDKWEELGPYHVSVHLHTGARRRKNLDPWLSEALFNQLGIGSIQSFSNIVVKHFSYLIFLACAPP